MALHWACISSLFLLSTAAAADPPAAAPTSTDDHANKCVELGFTGQNLCTDCKFLSEYVKDADLTKECEECCTSQATSDVKYQKAVLEVCYYRLGAYPHVQDFIKQKANDYSGLTVKDRWGSPPRITLSKGGKDGKQRETLRIDSWKGEQIEELVRTKLQPAAASA